MTSHEVDRVVKVDLYARANVPTYWLVDVPGLAVEVRTVPAAAGYRSCERYGIGAELPSPAPGAAHVEVGWLFERLVD